jgi:hypothetical protein
MTSTGQAGPLIQWRWDWFNAKHATTAEWASQNCVGVDRENPGTHSMMQRQVLQEEKTAGQIIAGELHQFIYVAAKITGMTYCCKLTQQTLACINHKDIRLSWIQNGDNANMKRLAWMCYYYGTDIHKIGRSCLTHGEWVERKVMQVLNVEYVHLTNLPPGQQTCLQQLYSRKFNDVRTNIMSRGSTHQHQSLIKKE